MEIDRLKEAVDILENTILNFPFGVDTKDDYMPIKDKITAIRQSLTAINARCLTLKAIINLNVSPDVSQKNLYKSFEKLNENTNKYLINKRALSICHQSRAIQDIIFKNQGSREIQVKVKSCLKKLFILNDKAMANNDKRKELMKKQYHLRFQSHCAIYDYHEFLKEKENYRNKKLAEENPNATALREKINRSLFKICTMKKLITNLIAPMCHELKKNEVLVEMLAKHKYTVNYETILEMTQNESHSSSHSS